MKRAWLVVIVLVLGSAAATAETGINAVVKLVEARYHVRHHGVPLLWMAKPFMIGSGAGGLKMAVFEDVRVPRADAAALQSEVRRTVGPEWSPFVESWSNDTGEWTAIYVRPSGHRLEMLIVAADEGEFTVMQMHVSGKARDEWVKQPVKHSHNNNPREQRVAAAGGAASSVAK